MQVTVSVVIMRLKVSAALMQVAVSTANMWVATFIVIAAGYLRLKLCMWHFLQSIITMTVSTLIMQVTVSAM